MVCPYSLSRPGGVQGQALGLARALRRRGHTVTVLAPVGGRRGATDGGSPPGGATVGIGRPVGLRSNGSVAPVTLSPAAAWRVARFARHHADVVHLHEPLAPVAGYGCLAGAGVPVVGTFHRSGGSAWYRALRPVAGWAAGRLVVRCAVSEAARATAEAALGRPCEVLFNGVEVDRFAGAAPAPTGGTPTVLFLGRHEERKGLGVLLAAFDQVPGPATLWVAGDGPATAALRARFPETPARQWLGVLTDDEVAARLAGADVLCAPSLGGESFGMVLLEGMAAGCAVVASDIDGYREAARGHAALVPPGDAPALAAALRQALADAAAGTGAATDEARRAAADHAGRWSMDRLAACYESRYLDATAPGGARPGPSPGDR